MKTKKQKFDNALELLEKSSKMYDMAMEILSSLGIEAYESTRPIELYDKYRKEKPTFYIYSGVSKIAEINGTELMTGYEYLAPDDRRYRSTMVNGILFHELV